LLHDLYQQISPAQFESFLSILLDEMGFSDVAVTGRSGDRGIDLEATWTQNNVPSLEVDLAFKIQAKRLKPSSTLNPRYIRELRGALASGEWGLFITTAKVSSKTRQECLNDSSRVISIIDGQSLIELCKKYSVGVKTNYQIDLSFLEEREITPEVPEISEKTTQEMLSEILREDFRRFGTSPIYKSKSKTMIARFSKFYNRKDANYWFGTKAVDVDRVKKYAVSHFAFICASKGMVLIPRKIFIQEIERDNLRASTTKDGQLIHYHIYFFENNGSMFWRLKTENKKIDEYFFKNFA
jgi:hypothetical protein